MTEWMPMNPCITCEIEFRLCPLYPKACDRFNYYQCEIKQTKKLLEWQIKHFPYVPEYLINMLKELEGQNG